MMKKFDVETAVGIFIFIGIVCMAYTAVHLGEVNLFGKHYYPVKAIFSSVKGLKKDTNIEISGVRVGKVDKIELDDYEAVVTLSVSKDIELQEDAIASIRTKGLLGEKYVEITPGGADEIIEPGGILYDTEPPIDIESLIKNFVFGQIEE